MATATASPTVLDQKLSRSPGKLGMLIFGAVLVVGVVYAGSSLIHDLSFVHSNSVLPYLLLGLALAGRAGLRVRQRLPRHGQRRGHSHLHSFAGAPHCRSLVRASGISSACWSQAA